MKRALFPIVNSLVFVMLFAVIGYYIFDPARWIVVGAVSGLAVGLLVEFGLGLVGGWLYRRRVSLVVLLEVALIIAFVGPFILLYVQTEPHHYTVCCIGDSGLGDQVEAVRIPVADGETLAGWYAPPEGDTGAVVMVLHGSQSDRRSSLDHARVLRGAGYGVLVYDQRASGESTGERQSVGLYDQHDITPIIDWLAARPEVNAERIGGVGLSLGAHILVMAAPGEPRLKAVWGDGLGINTIDDLPAFPGAGEAFRTFIERQSLWLGEIFLGERRVSYKALTPQIAPRPLVLIAGGADRYEGDINRGYEPYLGENGELWIVEGVPHVGGLTGQPEAYKARMLAFFDAALRQ